MEEKGLALKKAWNWPIEPNLASEYEIDLFQKKYNRLLPIDLSEYFKSINGSNGYDDNLFDFYPLNRFKPFTFNENESLFTFADYQCKLFSYSIKLHEDKINDNEIYIFCGSDYKILGNSFSQFLDLCLTDSLRLFFND